MQRFNENKFRVEYLYFAVFTTATVLLWIGFEVFRSLMTPAEIPEVSKEEIIPLSAEVNTQALNNIKGRVFIAQEELDQIEAEKIDLSFEAKASVKQATESASIEKGENEATQSANL